MMSTPTPASTSLCHAVSQVMRLNNEGIQMLEARRFDKAVSSLTGAISLFKATIAAHGEDEETASACQHELFFCFQVAQKEEDKAEEESTDNSTSSGSFVFDSPIRVSRRRCRKAHRPTSTHKMLKNLSFAMVFNLALAFHLSAVTIKTSKERRRLTKALAFYKLAATMIHSNDNFALGVMENLAVTNNQAHAFKMLGQHEESKECYDQVTSQVMIVAECGHQRHILLFERFFAAAIVVKTVNAAAAA